MPAPLTADGATIIDRLLALDACGRKRLLGSLSRAQRRELNERWLGGWAQRGQYVEGDAWRVWLIRAGRGFGKTRAGAEWVSDFARRHDRARIALVGATADDVRRVMIEGPSGVCGVARAGERVRYSRTAGEVEFASGARAYVYSAAAAEGLRGPEHDAAWCDELAKWHNGDAAWDNLMMGMRRGTNPQVLVTTTPRPTALMRRVMALPGLVETGGRTRDNAYLPAAFVAAVEQSYAGTRLGAAARERSGVGGPRRDAQRGAGAAGNGGGAALAARQALTILDLAVQAAVSGVGVAAPPAASQAAVGPAPAAPAIGASWIVADTPTGTWAGQARSLAGWTAGGWRFVAPSEGMAVWNIAERRTVRHVAGVWVGGVGAPAVAVPDPAGGSFIDAEARSAVVAILRTLRQQGLVAA